MILYHGSNIDISAVNLILCTPNKDFGCGFYLTENIKHAKSRAMTVVNRFGGEPVVSVFDFDIDRAKQDKVRIKDFGNHASKEWAQFVMNNRNKDFKNIKDANCNLDNKYEIVIGPIADDKMVAAFYLYELGYISLEEISNKLKYRELSIQYSFHTGNALSYLRKRE